MPSGAVASVAWRGPSTPASRAWSSPSTRASGQPAEIAAVPNNDDTWVQWKGVADVEEGDHHVRVRAIDKDGQVQTGVVQDVLPDGATGWHTTDFSWTVG